MLRRACVLPLRRAHFAQRGLLRAVLSSSKPAVASLRDILELLAARTSLTEEQAERALTLLLQRADAAQTAAFLVLLRAKGETAAEIAGLARAMRATAVPVDAGPNVLDIVGTGGDSAGTVNISTGACVVAAAAGARVAKHGNRSVSSLCGSGDVVEALGVAVRRLSQRQQRRLTPLAGGAGPRGCGRVRERRWRGVYVCAAVSPSHAGAWNNPVASLYQCVTHHFSMWHLSASRWASARHLTFWAQC